MKRLLLLATGGTIACRQTADGLAPVLSGDELLAALPAWDGRPAVSVCQLMNEDSTDLTAADRLAMARAVWDGRARYDGFVIAHGTDTLAYTAALLGYLLPDIDRPVVLTGSMLPMGVPGSDAPDALRDALRVAADGRAGVCAVLHGQIFSGSHVTKRHSTARQAFCAVGAPPIGQITPTGQVCWHVPPAPAGTPALVQQLDTRVVMLRLTPDLPPALLAGLTGYPAVILETFGAGGLPARLVDAVRDLIAHGTRVYLTSQCWEGGVDLQAYAVGRRAAALGAISLGTRTAEDALAAVMCGAV
ncbi:MAG: asparaginase [Eubacteriales bacterium]|nr:asparaginase [Eubacteriales bacterium]